MKKITAVVRRLIGADRKLQHELVTLFLLALFTLSLWVFIEIAEEVIESETHYIDEIILLAMRDSQDRAEPLGPRWMEEFVRDFSSLGSPGVLLLITLAVGGFFFVQRQYKVLVFLCVALFGGLLVTSLLKFGFDRPRPDLVPHLEFTYTASFPSGHSMMAAVAYLTLGALLARVQREWRVKAFILSVAIMLTLIVGISRVYLGVHWPSDVAAGWAAGAAWALFWWILARWMQRRGLLEG